MELTNQIFKRFGTNYSLVIKFKKKNLFSNRFKINSSYRFSKFHKIFSYRSNFRIISNFISSNSVISTGLFVQIVSRSSYFKYLADFQMKSFRNLLKKPYKHFIKFKIYPFFGLTKKPAEVRMGKGKGSKISHYSFPIYGGFPLIYGLRRSNSKVSDARLLIKCKMYLAKFPVKYSIWIGSI